MKIAPFVAASALFIAFGSSGQTKPCTTTCTVIITMSAGCGSGIKVAPDPIVVAKDATPTISWVIQADDWQFAPENGIVIQQATADSFEKNKAGGGKNVKIKHFNNKKNPRAYKYDINLAGPGGICTLDPTILDQ